MNTTKILAIVLPYADCSAAKQLEGLSGKGWEVGEAATAEVPSNSGTIRRTLMQVKVNGKEDRKTMLEKIKAELDAAKLVIAGRGLSASILAIELCGNGSSSLGFDHAHTISGTSIPVPKESAMLSKMKEVKTQ